MQLAAELRSGSVEAVAWTTSLVRYGGAGYFRVADLFGAAPTGGIVLFLPRWSHREFDEFLEKTRWRRSQGKSFLMYFKIKNLGDPYLPELRKVFRRFHRAPTDGSG